jgi:exodeoxyribonuclease V alpha subunit
MPAAPDEKQVLAGLVERVTFHNEENGFCVLRVKVRGQKDLITVIGHAASISGGEWVTASGVWQNDRTHGLQFRAQFLKATEPTSIEGMEKYLASGMIRGVGPVYAKRLIQAFGDKVFDVIQSAPGRLREVDGIGPRRAERIIAAWAEQKIVREIMIFLHSHGVGTSRAVLQDLRQRRRAAHVGKPVPADKRHPGHRFQDGGRDRVPAWHRQRRHDPGEGRDFLCAHRSAE